MMLAIFIQTFILSFNFIKSISDRIASMNGMFASRTIGWAGRVIAITRVSGRGTEAAGRARVTMPAVRMPSATFYEDNFWVSKA
jgi:hypothetical protein